MTITQRITRHLVENHAQGGPCEDYLITEKGHVYNYLELIPEEGITLEELLSLPIPFEDKMWVLDFKKMGFLRQILTSNQLAELSISLSENKLTIYNLWEISRYRLIECSTSYARGKGGLPTEKDVEYAGRILSYIAHQPE